MSEMSGAQIERLGERLRREVTVEDLTILRGLREGYRPHLEATIAEVLRVMGAVGLGEADIASRPAKTTRSIIAKLKREKTNLSRMQDIAGCRVVVPLLADQQHLLAALLADDPDWRVEDRRERPSHGYRAVHLVTPRPRPVEVQIRTVVQQLWAAVSESLDRRFEGVKYGQGPAEAVAVLQRWSVRLAEWETSGELTLELLADRDRLQAALEAILEES